MFNNQNIIANRIITELSECREDQRSSENRILQVIGVAAAIMGALFAISDGDSILSGFNYNPIVYSLISDMTFLGAFTYATTIGFECAFRYHYIRDIENKLRKIYEFDHQKEEYLFLNWIEVISPITTKNIMHLKHGFPVFYFLIFLISMVSAMVFGICTTYSLYTQTNGNVIAKVGFYSLVIVGAVLILIFIIGAAYSGKIYDYSRHKAEERCKNESK